jgi:hypothetical protein
LVALETDLWKGTFEFYADNLKFRSIEKTNETDIKITLDPDGSGNDD